VAIVRPAMTRKRAEDANLAASAAFVRRVIRIAIDWTCAKIATSVNRAARAIIAKIVGEGIAQAPIAVDAKSVANVQNAKNVANQVRARATIATSAVNVARAPIVNRVKRTYPVIITAALASGATIANAAVHKVEKRFTTLVIRFLRKLFTSGNSLIARASQGSKSNTIAQKTSSRFVIGPTRGKLPFTRIHRVDGNASLGRPREIILQANLAIFLVR
jgi:hypothetical protein